jgi:hypothetical protein
MSDYIPTTEQIADAWHFASRDYPFKSRVKRAEFNRWLAEHDREVAAGAWDEGYYRGVRDSELVMEPADNPYCRLGDNG